MYFSSQGAAKVVGPVLAQSARLVFIGAGGWWLSTHDARRRISSSLAAASMVVLGVLSALERHPDALGTEGRPGRRHSSGLVLIGRLTRLRQGLLHGERGLIHLAVDIGRDVVGNTSTIQISRLRVSPSAITCTEAL